MEDRYESQEQLRALAMRVAALEENVAFLEEWCEEQQDTLDRSAGPIGYDYEIDPPPPRAVLRVVDLRDGPAPADDDDDDEDEDEIGPEVDAIVAVVETEHDRRVRLLRAQINRLRTRLALSVAPPADDGAPRPAPRRRNASGATGASARPAGRTAP